ncbi:MAG: hypothetical protein J7455_19665 [Roseiflexus sp.]|nr:hypothetical protein [Roseiflexus sp.]
MSYDHSAPLSSALLRFAVWCCRDRAPSHPATIIIRTPTLILMAIIGEAAIGADVIVPGGETVADGVIERVAEGVSSAPYSVRSPDTTNGAAVGNPPGAQAGRRL